MSVIVHSMPSSCKVLALVVRQGQRVNAVYKAQDVESREAEATELYNNCED